jgi:hypothetical protein
MSTIPEATSISSLSALPGAPYLVDTRYISAMLKYNRTHSYPMAHIQCH